jgi:hypothetical protein
LNRLDGLRNRFCAPGFLVNSLPKSGTNLLTKAVGMFPGVRRVPVHITNRLPERCGGPVEGQAGVPVGVDWPRPVDPDGLRKALGTIKRGCYAHAHTVCSDALAGMLDDMGLKTLLILRDPRDVVVSHAKYVAEEANHLQHAHYRELSEADRIMASIVGVEPSAPGEAGLLDVGTRYRSLLAWCSRSSNWTTRFEWLVGPQGGGMRERQVAELAAIARHLGIRCSPGRLEGIADGLFGGTRTFRKGLIGGWREILSETHLRAMDRVAGDVLEALEKDGIGGAPGGAA